MNEIPKISIGTSMAELKRLVQEQSSLNDEAKASIFNFIEEESKNGDGKITNNIELTIVENFLKNIVNSIKMPEIKKEDASWTHEETTTSGTVQNIYRIEGINCTEETQQYAGSNSEGSWNTTCYVYQSGSPAKGVSDALVDSDSDGIADRRELTIYDENITSLVDTDLDGKFDKKNIHENPYHK